ncbi:MAG: hypothetical protein O2892_09075 [Actinomycetota bacterium]|nr:hypothetical protein [Actinomycetota bacterium]MDA2949180.1 hypothetical protein [Actinomycetota bacterium]
MNREDVAALLTALATGIPALPAALCRAEPALWDPHDRENEPPEDWHWRRDAAIRTCRSCPELARCAEYLDSTPADLQPLGVVAARVVRRKNLAVA